MNTRLHSSQALYSRTDHFLHLQEPRPYLSVFGMIVLFFAIACLLYPFCELIEILGARRAPPRMLFSPFLRWRHASDSLHFVASRWNVRLVPLATWSSNPFGRPVRGTDAAAQACRRRRAC